MCSPKSIITFIPLPNGGRCIRDVSLGRCISWPFSIAPKESYAHANIFVCSKQALTSAAAAHPRASRPDPHPLPDTHELLALQSFILDSPHATLSPHIDATEPLDAVMLLGAGGARRLGPHGSVAERAWLQTLADENARRVVLWYHGDRPPHYALEGVTARHGQGRRASTVNTSHRRDGDTLDAILARLGHDLKRSPILVIGGEVFDASPERVHELRESGKLAALLAAMGWS